MKSYKAFLVLNLLVAVALSSCSGLPKGVCTVNCSQGGTAKVSFIMVADTLPVNLSVISFRVIVTGITLTTSTGATASLSTNAVLDLMRLQSDSAFLGTIANAPTGQYTSVTLALTAQEITFLNTSAGAVGTCPSGSICIVPLPPTTIGTPKFTFPSAITISANTGFGIDFNLANAVTITGTTLNVNLTNSGNTNVITSFTLPRQNSNLASGQLDLIEDITGVVSIGNSGVAITPASNAGRLAITAVANSNTVLNADPSGNLCTNPTPGQVATCVSSNQAASMDAILKSDGTFSIQEIEPLLATLKDTVEGTVTSINANSQTQFTLIVTDLLPAAQNSLIGSLHVCDGLTVNLANNTNPFLVDTKGLPVDQLDPGTLNNFATQTTTGAIHLGQTVAVHIIAPFTAANGNTIASSSADTVTLRWSRLTSAVAPVSPTIFDVSAIPPYFNFTSNSAFQVQVFTNTVPPTNFDGVTDATQLVNTKPVAVRALFFENLGNTLNPAFFVAKVRQH